MTLSSVASRWSNTLRGDGANKVDLPNSIVGARRNRDRLSDLEAGTLAELAYEDSWDDASSSDDEAQATSAGTMMTMTITRESLSESVGLEIDIWARHSAAAAECVVGWVGKGTAADGHLRVGDAIHSVNGRPCCTIHDVKLAISGHTVMTFKVRRPTQVEIFSSSASLLMDDGQWLGLELCLASARVLELRPGGGYAPTVLNVREFTSVAMLPNRQLVIELEDGKQATLCTSSADLERWHTLLTQLMMFRPDTVCALTGWVHRSDDASSPPRYFELYSTGTLLIYASPHRNKLGQALCAVALQHANVTPDEARAGAWLITDMDRGAVWRCDHLQPMAIDKEPESIFTQCTCSSMPQAQPVVCN